MIALPPAPGHRQDPVINTLYVLEDRLPSPTELYWMRRDGSPKLAHTLNIASLWVAKLREFPNSQLAFAESRYVHDCEKWLRMHPHKTAPGPERYRWDIGKLDYIALVTGHRAQLYPRHDLVFIQSDAKGFLRMANLNIYRGHVPGAPDRFSVCESFVDAAVLVNHGYYDFTWK